jgi:actin related protein 2/3 complex, subunit 2
MLTIATLLIVHRPSAVDQTFTDYDGVAYHIESSKSGPLTLSMEIRCWDELMQYGAMDIIKREYGSYIKEPTESEYSLTLEFDFNNLPAEGGESACACQRL